MNLNWQTVLPGHHSLCDVASIFSVAPTNSYLQLILTCVCNDTENVKENILIIYIIYN